jgi:hypothetical protein
MEYTEKHRHKLCSRYFVEWTGGSLPPAFSGDPKARAQQTKASEPVPGPSPFLSWRQSFDPGEFFLFDLWKSALVEMLGQWDLFLALPTELIFAPQ